MRSEPAMQPRHVDALIVGAGISGIGMAYHLQDKCPGKSYAIWERRERLGGTWDLFRYPGIRSDSDMYTLGFSFKPWTDPKAIADGPAILKYLDETVREHGIDSHIRYGMRVTHASWSSSEACWTVQATDERTGESRSMTCNFLFMCAGYYNYDAGHTPDFEGAEAFKGRIVHAQQWTDDVDYDDKQVVVIGSGATAVTLVPSLAKRAAHVAMLQRSPTYIASKPGEDGIANRLRRWLPSKWAYALSRWKNIFISMFLYWYCRRFPERAAAMIKDEARVALGDGAEVDLDKHFTPHYAPWDQRVCLAPDGDFFTTLRSGHASVVTDHVDRFTENGLRLKSGETLEADLVVLATGLQIQFLGGMSLEVDGAPVDAPSSLVYKGMMLSDVPNLAFSIGYTNASWTLKVDLTSAYACRLLRHMDKHGYAYCCPRRHDSDVEQQPLLDLTSGYVQRAVQDMPKQGASMPWKLYQNYMLDMASLRYGRVRDGFMHFYRKPDKQPARLMDVNAPQPVP